MVARFLDANATRFGQVAESLWDYAEVGYQETRSSALLQSTLKEAGFTVEAGVAGIPTAFVASWSNGAGPVVGILAEFDALPGISQDRTAERTPIEEKRAGLFDDVDVVLHWHPGDRNEASSASSLANKSAKFRFRGVSAHAAASPERGRSALDAVEAMDHMVNMMREHVPQETHIHYVIPYGGAAPNVVPDFSEVFYYVRNPDRANVASIFERVVKAAEGAALGTGVEMDYEVIHGIYNLLPNVALQKAIHANLEQVGGVTWNDQERAFAEALHGTFAPDAPPLEMATQVQPFTATEKGAGGSTDVADVSWVVSTGEKGMIVGAKTLAMTAVDLFTNPALVAEVKAEHDKRVGPNFVYKALVGERSPQNTRACDRRLHHMRAQPSSPPGPTTPSVQLDGCVSGPIYVFTGVLLLGPSVLCLHQERRTQFEG
jgi:aminobenzoyl-glutamate utilization protein B